MFEVPKGLEVCNISHINFDKYGETERERDRVQEKDRREEKKEKRGVREGES